MSRKHKKKLKCHVTPHTYVGNFELAQCKKNCNCGLQHKMALEDVFICVLLPAGYYASDIPTK